MTLPLSLGLALLLAGLALGRIGLGAAGWLGVLVAGQAAALTLIDAGKGVHYQHVRPLAELAAHQPLALALVALQALVVVAAVTPRAGALRASLGRLLRPWQWLVLVIALVLSSATLSRDLPAYGVELAVASTIQIVQLLTLWLLVRALPDDAMHRFGGWLERILGPAGLGEPAEQPRVDRFTLGLAAGVTVVTALLALVVYQRHPHILDEVVYLIQARMFATGRVAVPPPAVPEAFELFLMQAAPQGWYSVVPPGWALVLVPGVWLGIEWLVNPLLAGLSIVLASLLLQQLYDRRTARLALVLLAVSPWSLFLGMSFMSHHATLVCALAAALGVLRARRSGELRWTWLGGLALGVIALIRQLDAMVVAGLLGLWAIGLGGRRLRWAATAGLVFGSMASAAMVLPYNRYFTGKPGAFPIMAYNDARYGKGANDYGFGPDRGMGWALDPGPGHGPRDAIINTNLNLTATQVELFGWATGSLLLVYLLLATGRLTRSDRLMLGVIVATWLAYFFNYFSGGPDFGARYWFLMLVPLCALSSRGLAWLGRLLAETGDRLGHARAAAGGTALVAAALITFVPWRASDRYWHYLGMRPDIASLARERGFGASLVMVCGDELPDYASAAYFNPLDFSRPAPLYVRDAGDEVMSRLRAAYPDRPLWIVRGPTRTGNGYEVQAGPIAPDQPAQDCHD